MTIGIEHTFKTHRWPIRVFCFFIGLIEVNVYLARRYFLEIDEEFVEFRKRLAFELMNAMKECTAEEGVTTRARVRSVEHRLITPPPYSK